MGDLVMIVEFAATPGAGKTTLLAPAVDVLRKQGWRAYPVAEAARLFAGRTWIGKAINLLAPPRIRRALLWQVFSISSFFCRLRFIARHPQLIQLVLRAQRARPASARVRERRTLHWFFHLAGCREFLAAHAQRDEALMFDDGFVHRAVHLYASPVEEPDPGSVRAYLDLIPRPDIIIVPFTPLEICQERVTRRGVWDHFRDSSKGDLARFLANSSLIVNIAVDYARKNQWTVVEVDNGTDDLPLAIQNLRTNLMSTFPPNTKQSNPGESPAPHGGPLMPRIPHLPRPSRLSEFARSRLRPLDIEIETVNHVLKSFELEVTRPPANLPLSRRTHNLIVHTSSGKKVLKHHRARHEIPALTFANSILKQLALLNFPAPRLVVTPTDDTFVTLDSGNYALFDFVEGVNYSLNFILPAHRLILMKFAGQTLASLHQTLEGFMPEGQHHLGFKSYTGGWQRDLAWHAAKVDELTEKSRHVKDEYEKTCADWIVKNSHLILEEVRGLDETLRKAPLRRLIIHGDYGLHNIIFQPGAIIPMDFESSRLEWRLSDLVSALSRLRRGDGTYNFQSIRSFLDGYQSVFPIGEEEWAYLPQVWRFYKLRASLIYWNSYFETGGPVRKLLSSRDAVSQAEWVIRHPEKLLNLNALAPI